MQKYRPIFIMGAPRSGTTLLCSMISSRRDVIALPEMHYMHRFLFRECIYEKITKDIVLKTLSHDPIFLDLDIVSNKSDIQDLIGENIKSTIFNIVAKFNICHLKKEKPKYWVEHSPHNHKYFNILNSVFPDSMFIHIVRDGRAVFSSTKETDWGYKDVITGAVEWRKSVSECIILEKLYPNKVITVKYENLINDPTETLKRVCEFVSIDFQPSMVKSGGIILPSFAKYQNCVNRKPHKKSMSKWKNSLKRFEVEHFISINYDLLYALGYDTNEFPKKELKGIKKILVRFIGMANEKYFKLKFRKRLKNILRQKYIHI